MRTDIAGFECIVENPGQSNCVVLFHGFGADFSDLAPLADFLDPDGEFTWIFPNGPQVVDIGYAMTGRAWFPISMAELEKSMATGVPRDYAPIGDRPDAALLGDLREFVKDLTQQYDGLILGGFSQGGMIASHLLGAAGSSLKGAFLMSTVLLNQKLLEESLSGVAPVPYFQSHGSQDGILHVKYGQSLYQFLKQKGFKGQWIEFAGGHEIPVNVLAKGQTFLKSLQG